MKSSIESRDQVSHELTDHSGSGKHTPDDSTEPDQEHDKRPLLLRDGHHQWIQVILEEYPGQSMAALHMINGAVLFRYRVLISFVSVKT